MNKKIISSLVGLLGFPALAYADPIIAPVVDSNIAEVVQDVIANPDILGKDGSKFIKNYSGDLVVSYTDRSPRGLTPDGIIGQGDILELNVNGNRYMDFNLDGFSDRSDFYNVQNESIVLVLDELPYFQTFGGADDEIAEQHDSYMKHVADIQKIIRGTQ